MCQWRRLRNSARASRILVIWLRRASTCPAQLSSASVGQITPDCCATRRSTSGITRYLPLTAKATSGWAGWKRIINSASRSSSKLTPITESYCTISRRATAPVTLFRWPSSTGRYPRRAWFVVTKIRSLRITDNQCSNFFRTAQFNLEKNAR